MAVLADGTVLGPGDAIRPNQANRFLEQRGDSIPECSVDSIHRMHRCLYGRR